MSPLKSTFGAASAFGWIPRAAGSAIPLSGVEFSVWGGGSIYGPGGIVVKKTGQTIAGSSNISVVIGAANSSSEISGAGFTTATAGVSSSVSGNIVNDVATQYQPSSASVRIEGWDSGYNYYYYGHYIYGSAPGAGGNGLPPAGMSSPVNGPAGGAGYSAVTSAGLSGFPNTLGVGGGGGSGGSPSMVWVYVSNGGYQTQMPLYAGSSPAYGANFGNGSTINATGFNNQPATSGGFTMRYSNTQLPLTSTTGTVVYLNSGGYHNYFWKSTGSFLV